MAGFQQPNLPTDTNHGPLINVASWIVIVAAALAAFAKVLSKAVSMRTLQKDDLFVGLSLLLAAGYTAALNAQVGAGLGQHISTLDSEQLARYSKTEYATNFLYIGSLVFAKLALLHFLECLSRIAQRRAAMFTLGITALLGIVMMFVVAFQCSLPQPWNILSGRCINQKAFWQVFGAMDIVTDLATFAIAIYLMHDVQMQRGHLVVALMAFMSRVILVPVIVLRMVYLGSVYESADRSWDSFALTIITTVQVGLSVVASCTPFLRTVIESMISGVMAVDMYEHRADSSPWRSPGISGFGWRNSNRSPRKVPHQATVGVTTAASAYDFGVETRLHPTKSWAEGNICAASIEHKAHQADLEANESTPPKHADTSVEVSTCT